MNYEQSLAYLASLQRFGINLGLSRIEKLLDLMQHPEQRYKTIHVTGTNGKGSTTAMLTSILAASGIKTGMYISPHLVDYTERMTINGEAISRAAFAGCIEYTKRFVDKLAADGFEHPTEFEIITAAAFYYFAASGVEYAVIEVGLGGRFDSTNVIMPEVSVITNVSVEHTDRCGKTVGEIAAHKAGIIKSGVPVVTAAQSDALAVIMAEAGSNNSPVYVYGREFSASPAGRNEFSQTIRFREPGLEPVTYEIGLLGTHQVSNSAVAVKAACLLMDGDRRITQAAIKTGLRQVRWPGRFEIMRLEPAVIVDGAHNPAGARVLRDSLDELFAGKPISFVLGILADKDIDGILQALIRETDRVFVVKPQSDRADDPADIVRRLAPGQAQVACTVEAGVKAAIEAAGAAGVVCIAGSLYLVGEARQAVGRQVHNTPL